MLTSSDPLDHTTLDAHIEEWLKMTFDFDIDFEVDDALAKFEPLGLLKRNNQMLSVLPLNEAFILLDHRWDNFFLFANHG